MTWIAKINIGKYKIGDEVPLDQAKLWIEAYAVSPVEEVKEAVPEKVVRRNKFKRGKS